MHAAPDPGKVQTDSGKNLEFFRLVVYSFNYYLNTHEK